MKRVLVIIPHFNKLILLKECLFHLDKQTYEDFDVMIVDNGSTDSSAEYIFGLAKSDTKYKCALLHDNMGFAYAVNRGLQYSIDRSYEFSILLNNDAYIEDNFISELVNKIKNEKNKFAVSSFMINYHKKDLIDSFGDNYCLFGWGFQNKIAEKVEDVIYDENCFSACAGASIYRNSILTKIGLFDESFFAYLEDMDISYRAKLNGYSISTCKNARCYHLGSATSGGKYNDFKVRISARNNIYLIYKNMPLPQIIINIFPLFVGILIKQIFFIFKGYGASYFLGIIDGFKNASKVVKNDFKNISIFRYLIIEIELIINTFKYVINFVKRHV